MVAREADELATRYAEPRAGMLRLVKQTVTVRDAGAGKDNDIHDF